MTLFESEIGGVLLELVSTYGEAVQVPTQCWLVGVPEEPAAPGAPLAPLPPLLGEPAAVTVLLPPVAGEPPGIVGFPPAPPLDPGEVPPTALVPEPPVEGDEAPPVAFGAELLLGLDEAPPLEFVPVPPLAVVDDALLLALVPPDDSAVEFVLEAIDVPPLALVEAPPAALDEEPPAALDEEPPAFVELLELGVGALLSCPEQAKRKRPRQVPAQKALFLRFMVNGPSWLPTWRVEGKRVYDSSGAPQPHRTQNSWCERVTDRS